MSIKLLPAEAPGRFVSDACLGGDQQNLRPRDASGACVALED